jgi:hypothetical protein
VATSAAFPPRVGVWLIAWLAGQLGWTPVQRRTPAPGLLEATFTGPSGEVRARLLTEADSSAPFAHLTGVSLGAHGTAGKETFRLSRTTPEAREVRIDVSSSSHCALPRVLHAPEYDPPCRVSAAIESSRRDPPFQRALPHALWLLEG